MGRWFVLNLVCACAIAGCGGNQNASSETVTEDTTAQDGAGGEDGPTVIIEDDDNRVSRSAGEEGGVVVLWPRVMGLPEREPAQLQEHMVALARRVFRNRPVDVRPDPERVCPRGGCHGVSLGALLVAQNGSCTVVAVIGRPGEADLTLVPWAGDLTVRDRNIPFREPPESHLTLHDAIPCSELVARVRRGDREVEAALRGVTP